MPANLLRRGRARPLRLALSVAALVVGALLFAPLYLLPVYALAWRWLAAAGAPAARAGALAGRCTHLPNLILSDPGRCALALGLGAGLALAALLVGHPGRALRSAAALILVAVVALPWHYGYRPAVVAAPGHELHLLTQPGLVEGVAKQAQAFAEVHPCRYTLLGWADDGTLYYRAEAPGRPAETWAFAPGQDARPWLASGPSSRLSAAGPQPPALECLRAAAWPREAEPATRLQVVQGEGLASPDGRWLAVVVRHIHGPEDVVVVSQAAARAALPEP
jgi:hypothetical protein